MKEMIDFLDNKRFQPLTFRKPFSNEYNVNFGIYTT